MNSVEGAAERAWWQSKKLVAVLAHHAVTTLVALVGLWQFPAQAGAILAGYFTSAATVTGAHLASQAATDRAQANSPNYPLPPAQPVTSQVSAPSAASQPPAGPGSTGMQL